MKKSLQSSWFNDHLIADNFTKQWNFKQNICQYDDPDYENNRSYLMSSMWQLIGMNETLIFLTLILISPEMIKNSN